MTGMQGRGGTPAGPPAGPPWSVDVLADLHAGVFDEAESARLWPLVNADPEAREVLAALDSTLDDLHGMPEIPVPAMPPEFAARLDAAIAAEAAARPAAAVQTPSPAPVIDLARARQQRNRRLGWAGGVVAVAAAVAAVVLVVGQPKTTGGQSVAAAPPTGGSSMSSGQLNLSSALAAVGRSDYGPLADPARLSACLAANGQDPNRKPAGASQITLDGKPGVLLVLTTGHTAQFRLLVVGPDCAAGRPDTLADAVVGGTPTS